MRIQKLRTEESRRAYLEDPVYIGGIALARV